MQTDKTKPDQQNDRWTNEQATNQKRKETKRKQTNKRTRRQQKKRETGQTKGEVVKEEKRKISNKGWPYRICFLAAAATNHDSCYIMQFSSLANQEAFLISPRCTVLDPISLSLSLAPIATGQWVRMAVINNAVGICNGRCNNRQRLTNYIIMRLHGNTNVNMHHARESKAIQLGNTINGQQSQYFSPITGTWGGGGWGYLVIQMLMKMRQHTHKNDT